MHPLDLLCACLWAGQRGQQLGNLHVMALLEPDADLVALMQLAGRHRVTPMLAKGILGAEQSRDLPDDFRFYLRFIHARNEARNSALQRQLGEAAACLNLIGIEPVLLKGAIRLVDGLYPDLGWRLMRDLDLLVPRERLHDAVAQLRRIGYASSSLAAPRRHWHLPPLARAAAEAVIEVHEDLLGRPGLCSAEQMIARSQPTIVDGARARVPVIVDQLVHLIAHDRLDAPFRHARMLFLRSIFEILLLAQSRTIVQEVVGRFALVDLAFWPQAAFGTRRRTLPGRCHARSARDGAWPSGQSRTTAPPGSRAPGPPWQHAPGRRLYARTGRGTRELRSAPEIFHAISPVRELLSPMLQDAGSTLA